MILALGVALLVTHALIGEQGLSPALDARRAHQRLAAEVDAIRAENARLQGIARRLRGDLAAIEAVAREELGLIRPGETVVLLGGGPRGSRPGSPPAGVPVSTATLPPAARR